jgi:indolepyruvate ferredoxin oxidoreductase
MQVDLEDKYRLDAGRIYLSGIQALVRLPLLQRQRDRAHNLKTAGFISGYRGSPLGMYDHALWRAKSHLQANDIAFVPGLNEDLAATAVWGSQQVGLYPGAKVDGVFGIWYGKGPGVDRSMDPLKHANSAGTSRHGGVLAFAGDDHGCQSSTLAHQSEQVFAAAMMPVLNPATLQDYLDLGILGFALSRYSGCWVGFKAISETVESSASIFGDPSRIEIVTPDDFAPPPAGCGCAGRIRRWRRSAGCMARKCRPSPPSPAPTSSTGSCSTAARRGSASSPPARPISICARRLPTSGSPTKSRGNWGSASTRSR